MILNLQIKLNSVIRVKATEFNGNIAKFLYYGYWITAFVSGVSIKSLPHIHKKLKLNSASLAALHISALLAYYLSIFPNAQQLKFIDIKYIIRKFAFKNKLAGPRYTKVEQQKQMNNPNYCAVLDNSAKLDIIDGKIMSEIIGVKDLEKRFKKVLKNCYNLVEHTGSSTPKENFKDVGIPYDITMD